MNLIVCVYSNFPSCNNKPVIGNFGCQEPQGGSDISASMNIELASSLYIRRCIDEYIVCDEFGMHVNRERCLLSSGLQGNPFDREGVFEYGHLYDSQSIVTYLFNLLCMTCMTYDCVHIHNHDDIDNLICMNACVCTYMNRHAFCIYFGSSAQALEFKLIVPIVR